MISVLSSKFLFFRYLHFLSCSSPACCIFSLKFLLFLDRNFLSYYLSFSCIFVFMLLFSLRTHILSFSLFVFALLFAKYVSFLLIDLLASRTFNSIHRNFFGRNENIFVLFIILRHS